MLRELVEARERRRALAARAGRGRRSRASASARSSTGWRARSGLAGFVLNDERGVLVEVEGDAEAVDALPRRGCRPRRRRWRASSAVACDAAAADRRARLPRSSRAPHGGEPDALGRRRRGDLRRLPGRALRPRRPPLPLPVRQLHQLRAALHDRARRPLRPAADDDGRLRDVPGAARPSTTTRPTAASTPSPTPARSAGRARARCGGRLDRRRRRCAGGRGAAADGAIVAVKGLGGYHLACRADDEHAVARAARAQAPRGQAVRADGAATLDAARTLVELGEAEAALLARRASARSCSRRGAPARPSRRRSPRAARELGVMLPYSPLHHLLLRRRRRRRS